jgi:hypothetical protein
MYGSNPVDAQGVAMETGKCSQNAGSACFAHAASRAKANFTTHLGSGDLW